MNALLLIFDNSVLIVLIERLKLTNELVQLLKKHQILVPQTVFCEFCKKAAPEKKKFVQENFQIKEIPPKKELEKLLEPDSGETAVLSEGLDQMKNNADFACVVDENTAREACQLFGLKKSSSIGILKLMHEEKIVDMKKLQELKAILKSSDFYIAPHLLDWID